MKTAKCCPAWESSSARHANDRSNKCVPRVLITSMGGGVLPPAQLIGQLVPAMPDVTLPRWRRPIQFRRPTSASSCSGGCGCLCRSGHALAPSAAHSMPMATTAPPALRQRDIARSCQEAGGNMTLSAMNLDVPIDECTGILPPPLARRPAGYRCHLGQPRFTGWATTPRLRYAAGPRCPQCCPVQAPANLATLAVATAAWSCLASK